MTDICFYTDSDIVKKVYRENSNYKVEISDKKDMSCCAVYFSSNGIYFPNDIKTFTREIIEKNNFEWYKTRVNRATKHIFVRDIHKEWYLSGINSKVSDLHKLKEWLSSEIKGYDEIVFIGSSAGAWCAMLMGYWLKVSIIFAFSPQINLDVERFSGKDSFPYLSRYSDTDSYNYYNLRNIIKDGGNIFWFYPNLSKDDFLHYQEGKSIPNIHIASIRLSIHGVPFSKPTLLGILNSSRNRLKRYNWVSSSYIGINIYFGGIKYLFFVFTSWSEIKRLIKSIICQKTGL